MGVDRTHSDEVRRHPLPRIVRRRRRRSQAAARVGDAVLLWHADRDLQGVDAVIVPGGFSYGDYLRAGAIARFAPVMAEVERVRARGRARARDLQRFPGAVRGAACCPGRCCRTSSLKFVFRQVELEVVDQRHAVHARVRPRRPPVDPGQAHHRPLLRARRRARPPRGGRPGRCSATRPATTRTARCATSPASCNEQGNVFGLMPHPEHAVDPLTGSTDGLKIFESIASACRAATSSL